MPDEFASEDIKFDLVVANITGTGCYIDYDIGEDVCGYQDQGRANA